MITFCKASVEHVPVITKWLNKKHVREFFYGEGLQGTLDSLNDYVHGIPSNESYSFDHWMGFYDGMGFAFLMTSPVVGPYNPSDPIDKFFDPGKETITLDLLIGEEEFLGRGLGVKLIKEFLSQEFPRISRVLIDPEVANTKAIHVYEKAGFKKIEQFQARGRPHWMMLLHAKEAP
jgi:RimJ/RimL family protein N-acetyltransferase